MNLAPVPLEERARDIANGSCSCHYTDPDIRESLVMVALAHLEAATEQEREAVTELAKHVYRDCGCTTEAGCRERMRAVVSKFRPAPAPRRRPVLCGSAV